MESNAFAKPYFAAYPLKAVISQVSESTVNSQISNSRLITSLRISPMADPYQTEKTTSINNIKLPKDVQPAESDPWFQSYE